MIRLYPEPKEANQDGMLKVSELHEIYWHEYGNPAGIPLVHLHGGPGSKSKPKYAQYYNPEKYRIVLFDQRGCGKSTPAGELTENTTADLIADLEKLREYLQIESWAVSGGSWGSTLAIAYAEEYSEKVRALILRGVFTCRQAEIDWIDLGLAARFHPELWEQVKEFTGETDSKKIREVMAHKILNSDGKEQQAAVAIWMSWEGGMMGLMNTSANYRPEDVELEDIHSTKILWEYMQNSCFLEEGQLLQNAGKLKNIPGIIIQGRYDMVCPPKTAYELHKAWPTAEFKLVRDAGHHSSEPGIIEEIINYTDKL